MLGRITMKDLHERVKKLGGQEIVLDVRGLDEYVDGHVPGSINIPHDQVGAHVAELKKYERIYVHCRSGKRAQMATADLERAGLKNLVCIADGGMMDWAEAGYEMVKGK